MSESIPHYIPCASENNAFTDCLLMRVGDLIRLVGHPSMEFTADDARKLADSILKLLDQPYRGIESPATMDSGDAIVDALRAMLLKRARLGQAKYGTTLMRNDLTLLDWMRHAIEESLDRTLYMMRALKDLEKLYDDGR